MSEASPTQPEPSPLSGLLAALYAHPEYGPKLRATDEIEAEVTDAAPMVMLDVAYSPVILHPGQDLNDAVKIHYAGLDGRYVIKDPPGRPEGSFLCLSPEEARIARARYLILNGRRNAPFVEALIAKAGGAK